VAESCVAVLRGTEQTDAVLCTAARSNALLIRQDGEP
jgi:hypothetical protein